MKRAKKETKFNNKKKAKEFFKIFFIIILILCVLRISMWIINGCVNKNINKEISNLVIENENDIDKNVEKDYKINFEEINKINNDTVAWIKVPGTQIKYFVVKGNNNNYYLNHNFEKKYNKAGWIFADYKNKFDGTDKNIVLYGHNRADGTMFGSLKNVLKTDWYNNKNNYEIIFLNENGEKQKYQVFSVYQIKTEDYYIKTEFKKGEFKEFIIILKNRSQKDFGVEVLDSDCILTLSTCANNYKDRIVLHAKRIESKM